MAIINGTSNDDILNGTIDADTINGLGGNDTLIGNEGDDYLLGYDPLETSIEDVNSNPGDPSQFEDVPTLGKYEINYLYGGTGNDTLDNGAAEGELHGGDGADVLRGYAHQDGMGGVGEPPSSTASMYGDAGNDFLQNGAFMDGGEGDDRIENEGELSSRIYGGTGNDTVFAAGVIYGGDGNDDISGRVIVSVGDWDNPTDTTRYGSWIEAFGEGGDDRITSDTGFLDGGAGNDTLILNGSKNEKLEGSQVYGGDGNDWIEGNIRSPHVWLRGVTLAQADILDGGNGDDTIVVHTRANVEGGEGNDLIQLRYVYGVDPQDTVNAFTGELIDFSSSDSTVGSWVDGGAGYDVVEIVDFRVFTVANFADGFELTNIERLVGNTLDNIINLTWLPVGDINVQGLGGHDIIWSNIGNDTLEGGAGNDTIRGAAGNDAIFGGNDQDVLKGGDGGDTIYGDNGNDELYGESGSDDLYGGAGNDKLSGGDDVDRLNGGDGTDKLYGGMGNDQLKGDAGNDSLSGDDGNDRLWGSFGDDTLNGGNGTDELYGDDANDKLYGGAGVDKLSGGAGNDKLTGGDGSDNLWGGTGSDQFVFDAASLSARDTVKDFSMAQGDKLELYNILTGYDPLTSAISDFVKATESSGKSYLSVDTNGSTDGALFIQIAQIDNTVGITNVGQLLTDHVLIVTNTGVV